MAPEVVRPAFIASTIVALFCIGFAFVMYDMSGLIGALLASVLVLGFFMTTHLFVTRMMNKDVRLGMTAALLSYTVKILVMLLLILLFRNTTLFNTQVFGFTIVILTLVWTLVEVFAFSRFRSLTVVPGSGPKPDSTQDSGH